MKPPKKISAIKIPTYFTPLPKIDGIPPDPDGTFERAATRAEKVVLMYDEMDTGCERKWLMTDLLFDLLNLCDRDPSLGAFERAYMNAIDRYEQFIAENDWMKRHGLTF